MAELFYRNKVCSYIANNWILALDNNCSHCQSLLQQYKNEPLKFNKNKGGYIKHASSCIHVLKKLCKQDAHLIEQYCLEQKNNGTGRKLSNKVIQLLLPYIENNEKSLISTISSAKTQEYNRNSYAQDYLLSSQIVFSPSEFPETAGIYLIRFLNNNKWDILYIGKSVNLKVRWSQHHRANEILFLKNIGIQLEYRYLAENSLIKFVHSLEDIEKILIKAFNPKLNSSTVLDVIAS